MGYNYDIDKLLELLAKHGYDTSQNLLWDALLYSLPQFRLYLDNNIHMKEAQEEELANVYSDHSGTEDMS